MSARKRTLFPLVYRRLGQAAVSFCLLAASVGTAQAWWVYNETGMKVRAKVLNMQGGSTDCGDWGNARGQEIAANGSASANYASTKCNPTRRRDSTFLLQLVIEGSNNGNLTKSKGYFQCFLKMRGDGYAKLLLQPRPNFSTTQVALFGSTLTFTPPNPYCASYFEEDMNRNGRFDTGDVDINRDGRYSSVVVDYNDYFARSTHPAALPAMTPANRDVRFLITGDPQYWDDGSITEDDERNEVSDTTLKAMTRALNANKQIRGILVSGDLTQNASNSELESYESAIADAQHFVFEGLGNHDIEDMGASSHPDKLRKYVGEKARATSPTLRFGSDDPKSPHYSWDWHDVHFVQLDLFPGDAPSADYDGKGEHKKLDPRKALSFLKADLEYYVGASGRPVVLIHHYGFDNFSTGTGSDYADEIWWNELDRALYWNTIGNYNVVAIFTGHSHLSPGNGSWNNYSFHKPELSLRLPGGKIFKAGDRPDGRTSIPSYNAAAAAKGAYLDVTIDRCNQLNIRRMDEQGAQHEEILTRFSTPGAVAASCTAP